MAFLFSFHNGGAIEGADFLRYLVEVMEDAVVGFLWDAVDIADVFGRPGGKDEEGAVLTGMETGGFGFPITGDGFFLDMDEGIAALYTAFLYHSLTL